MKRQTLKNTPGAQRSGGSTHAHGEAEDEYRVPWDDEVFFGGALRIRNNP